MVDLEAANDEHCDQSYLKILKLVQAKTLVVYDLFKFLERADGAISPDRIKMDLQLLLWHCRTNSFEKGKRTILELWDQYGSNECKKSYIFKARLNSLIFTALWEK